MTEQGKQRSADGNKGQPEVVFPDKPVVIRKSGGQARTSSQQGKAGIINNQGQCTCALAQARSKEKLLRLCAVPGTNQRP